MCVSMQLCGYGSCCERDGGHICLKRSSSWSKWSHSWLAIDDYILFTQSTESSLLWDIVSHHNQPIIAQKGSLQPHTLASQNKLSVAGKCLCFPGKEKRRWKMIRELIESNRDFHIQDSAIFMGDELGFKIFTANLDAKGPKARLNWGKKG